jgi:peroxiredoxin
MREVPGLVKAYEAYRGKGFEVLGVSLDREKAEGQIKTVTAKQGMAWEQIYDGRFFDAKIAKQYGIQAIPATYLVDGDTGKILAMGADLRGERLAKTIEKALETKAGKAAARG